MRWIAVVPAALLGWWFVVLASVAIHAAVFRLCPADEVVSGACVAPWFSHFETGLLYGSAALSAIVVVVAATVTAPSSRPLVALLAFLLGVIAALLLGGPANETIVACIAGFAAVLVVGRHYARSVA